MLNLCISTCLTALNRLGASIVCGNHFAILTSRAVVDLTILLDIGDPTFQARGRAQIVRHCFA